jgi:hypothetical protein
LEGNIIRILKEIQDLCDQSKEITIIFSCLQKIFADLGKIELATTRLGGVNNDLILKLE